MNKVQFCFLIMLVVVFSGNAQQTYISRQGVLMMQTLSGDSLNQYRFNNIIVVLNYAESLLNVNFRLDDQLDSVPATNRFYSNHDTRITTRLSLPRIETQSHPDWRFEVRGELFYDEDVYYLLGTGVLKHIPGGEEVSCTLLLNMKLTDDSKEFIIPHLGVVQDIHLYQLVLSREALIEAEKAGY